MYSCDRHLHKHWMHRVPAGLPWCCEFCSNVAHIQCSSLENWTCVLTSGNMWNQLLTQIYGDSPWVTELKGQRVSVCSTSVVFRFLVLPKVKTMAKYAKIVQDSVEDSQYSQTRLFWTDCTTSLNGEILGNYSKYIFAVMLWSNEFSWACWCKICGQQCNISVVRTEEQPGRLSLDGQ